jgi:hypothetical protein
LTATRHAIACGGGIVVISLDVRALQAISSLWKSGFTMRYGIRNIPSPNGGRRSTTKRL